MNYLIYPFKKLAITQRYDETFSHGANYNGTPRDYSIDDNGGTTAKDSYFYCPCESMTVKKIYGIGSSSTNTVWLESNNIVKGPNFEDYVTILLMHTEDEDLKDVSVGKTYTFGEKVLLEGKDGYATGNHFHMSIGKGKFKDAGWLRNSQGAWVIDTTGGAIKPEDAMYLDESFTTVINSRGIVFEKLPTTSNNLNEGIVTASILNVRSGPGTNYDVVSTLKNGNKVNIINQQGTWYEIETNRWVSSYYIKSETNGSDESNIGYVKASNLNVRKGAGLDNEVINMLPNNTKVTILASNNGWCKVGVDQWVSKEYIVSEKPSVFYETKEVTATYLNVRKSPNGEKTTTYAPLKNETIVADIETNEGWTKIGNNRYVYTYYLK